MEVSEVIIRFKGIPESEIICDILKTFSPHTKKEIYAYFPNTPNTKIDKILTSLLYTGRIKNFIYENEKYYTSFYVGSINETELFDKRANELPALTFLRAMINSSDECGNLVNNVTYLSPAPFPKVFIFQCNETLYDVFYLKEEQATTINTFIKRLDQHNETIDESRIVITDSPEYFEEFTFDNIKFVVCFDKDGNMIVR